jgi:hypothetical protein
METILTRLNFHEGKIPQIYKEFCIQACFFLRDGEDVIALFNLVNDLADFTKSKYEAVENFVSSCSDGNVTSYLEDILEGHLESRQNEIEDYDQELDGNDTEEYDYDFSNEREVNESIFEGEQIENCPIDPNLFEEGEEMPEWY